MSVTRYPAVGAVFWTPLRLRALRHGLWLGAAAALIIVASNLTGARFGVDAHAYWLTSHRDNLYGIAPRQLGAYHYSPAFAQAVRPLALLPWPAFCALWLGAVGAAYLWLLAPLSLEWRLPLLLLCAIDIVAGNIWAFFALVLVFGFRTPGLWAFPVLTKVTPVVGPAWFLARREWRALAIAIATTLGLVAISYVAAPHLWSDWVHYLRRPEDVGAQPSVALRAQIHPPAALFVAVALPIAIATTVFAARTERAWLLPVAMVLATPFFSANAFAVLAAIPRIRENQQREEYRHGDSNPGFRRERAAS